jgi:hypothetical protein
MTPLPLKYPLSFGSKTIDQLNFRDYATAEDFLAFDEPGQQRATIQLIANLTGNDFELVKQLRAVDYRAADKIATALIRDNGGESPEKNLPAS